MLTALFGWKQRTTLIRDVIGFLLASTDLRATAARKALRRTHCSLIGYKTSRSYSFGPMSTIYRIEYLLIEKMKSKQAIFLAELHVGIRIG